MVDAELGEQRPGLERGRLDARRAATASSIARQCGASIRRIVRRRRSSTRVGEGDVLELPRGLVLGQLLDAGMELLRDARERQALARVGRAALVGEDPAASCARSPAAAASE